MKKQLLFIFQIAGIARENKKIKVQKFSNTISIHQ
jgi:hypothetical protein